jgi:hypothetical protein
LAGALANKNARLRENKGDKTMFKKIAAVLVAVIMAVGIAPIMVKALEIPGVSARQQKNADGTYTYYVEEKEVTFQEFYEVQKGKIMTDGHWMTQEEFEDYIKRKVNGAKQSADEKTLADNYYTLMAQALLSGADWVTMTAGSLTKYYVGVQSEVREVSEAEYNAYVDANTWKSIHGPNVQNIVEEYTPMDHLPLPEELLLSEDEMFYLNAIQEMRVLAGLGPLEVNEGLMLPAKSDYLPAVGIDKEVYLTNWVEAHISPDFSSYSVAPQYIYVITFPNSWTTKRLQEVLNFEEDIRRFVTNPDMTTIGLGLVPNYFPDSAGDHHLVIYIAGDSLSSKYPMGQSSQFTPGAADASVLVPSVTEDVSSEVTVLFNGNKITFTQPPTERHGYVFYPLEDVFAGFGAAQEWNGATYTFSGSLNGNKVEIPLRTLEYIINGKILDVTQELAPFVANERTYVYLDYVVAGLGLTVAWDSATKTISITN